MIMYYNDGRKYQENNRIPEKSVPRWPEGHGGGAAQLIFMIRYDVLGVWN